MTPDVDKLRAEFVRESRVSDLQAKRDAFVDALAFSRKYQNSLAVEKRLDALAADLREALNASPNAGILRNVGFPVQPNLPSALEPCEVCGRPAGGCCTVEGKPLHTWDSRGVLIDTPAPSVPPPALKPDVLGLLGAVSPSDDQSRFYLGEAEHLYLKERSSHEEMKRRVEKARNHLYQIEGGAASIVYPILMAILEGRDKEATSK